MIYFYRYIRTQRQVSATEPPLAQFEWEGVNQNGKSCGIWKLFKCRHRAFAFEAWKDQTNSRKMYINLYIYFTVNLLRRQRIWYVTCQIETKSWKKEMLRIFRTAYCFFIILIWENEIRTDFTHNSAEEFIFCWSSPSNINLSGQNPPCEKKNAITGTSF